MKGWVHHPIFLGKKPPLAPNPRALRSRRTASGTPRACRPQGGKQHGNTCGASLPLGGGSALTCQSGTCSPRHRLSCYLPRLNWQSFDGVQGESGTLQEQGSRGNSKCRFGRRSANTLPARYRLPTIHGVTCTQEFACITSGTWPAQQEPGQHGGQSKDKCNQPLTPSSGGAPIAAPGLQGWSIGSSFAHFFTSSGRLSQTQAGPLESGFARTREGNGH